MTASHPWNLALRFGLEVSALAAAAIFGWGLAEGPLSVLMATALPVLVAFVWALFAVPGDPSRSGRAPVPVPGPLRLALELAIFAGACWVLYSTGAVAWSLALGGATAIHYALSLERIAWLFGRGAGGRAGRSLPPR